MIHSQCVGGSKTLRVERQWTLKEARYAISLDQMVFSLRVKKQERGKNPPPFSLPRVGVLASTPLRESQQP